MIQFAVINFDSNKAVIPKIIVAADHKWHSFRSADHKLNKNILWTMYCFKEMNFFCLNYISFGLKHLSDSFSEVHGP